LASPGLQAPGCEIAHSLDQALELARPQGEAIVMGGASVYEEALPRCHRLHLTIVDADFEGDAFFPALRADRWEEHVEGVFASTSANPYPYRFLTLEPRDRMDAGE
jgi:dihydrofolate reductase